MPLIPRRARGSLRSGIGLPAASRSRTPGYEPQAQSQKYTEQHTTTHDSPPSKASKSKKPPPANLRQGAHIDQLAVVVRPKSRHDRTRGRIRQEVHRRIAEQEVRTAGVEAPEVENVAVVGRRTWSEMIRPKRAARVVRRLRQRGAVAPARRTGHEVHLV